MRSYSDYCYRSVIKSARHSFREAISIEYQCRVRFISIYFIKSGRSSVEQEERAIRNDIHTTNYRQLLGIHFDMSMSTRDLDKDHFQLPHATSNGEEEDDVYTKDNTSLPVGSHINTVEGTDVASNTSVDECNLNGYTRIICAD